MISPQSLLMAALCWALWCCTQTFKPMISSSGSVTHRQITEKAILLKTAEVCQDFTRAEGRNFSLTIDHNLAASQVLKACLPDTDPTFLSTVKFRASIFETYMSNGIVDMLYVLSAKHHFDDETFTEGRGLITAGVASIKAGVKTENFHTARLTLGRVFHTLQDFYSHSNWIELKNTVPYTILIRPDLPFDNVADEETPTCSDCLGDCTNNILEDIINENKLTTGYFSLFSSSKPAGKCSHGGFLDRTSCQLPRGGINKDDKGASHGHLHEAAVKVAISATVQLLEDIRRAVGDVSFLQLMGITRSSVLCFVIDTTGSMSDDIEEAKRVAFSIIDSKKGTLDEPAEYILVPFNDPDVGPLTKTTNADIFKKEIGTLRARGGGDIPEMCLSGLQVALSGAPPSSEIFVFTDAPAKDIRLKSTVLALIDSTKSVVTFMLTHAFSLRRRRSTEEDEGQRQQHSSRKLNQANGLYQELAQVSGGQAIEMTKSSLPQATNILVDSGTSALVTIFQAVGNPDNVYNYSFVVDSSVRKLSSYITGRDITFTLYSPSGMSQSNAVSNGPLGTIQTVGNLYRVQLNSQVGKWKISISSTQPYTVKVAGQSMIDFMFVFVKPVKGSDYDVALREGRPQSGENATLFLTVTENTFVKVTEVSLVDRAGLILVISSTVEDLGQGDYLVYMHCMPTTLFSVKVMGVLANSSQLPGVVFQRQSNTQTKTSNISISAQANTTLEPGTLVSIPFSVTTSGPDGNYMIIASNDKGFYVSFPATISVVNGSAQHKVDLKPTATTPSGTDVTLTIMAESSDGSDSNYAVLRFSIITKVTDFSAPVCQVLTVSANCLDDCSLSSWLLSAKVSDGNGTGVQTVYARGGNGTLSSNASVMEEGSNITQVLYSASCCSPEVELVAVDAVGNVGLCFHSIRLVTSGPSPSACAAITASLLCVLGLIALQLSALHS